MIGRGRSGLAGLGLALALLAPLPLLAGPPGASSGKFTPPLASAELPDGVVTVKIVGKGMTDLKVGQQVTLLEQAEAGSSMQTAATGQDGRAKFKGLRAGVRYVLMMTILGKQVRSAAFKAPASGGFRFLVFLEAEVSSMTGGGQTAPPGEPVKMPAGHPPVGDDKPAAPTSKGAAEITEAKDLPAGQIEVLVLKGRGKAAVKGAPVLLGSSAQLSTAHGKPLAVPTVGRRSQTDQRGVARFTLDAAKAAPQMVQIEHDQLVYRSRSIEPSAEHGLRLTFQVYDRTSSKDKLKVASIRLLSRVTEGAVSFMQVLTLSNEGDAIFDPGKAGLRLPVPRGVGGLEVHKLFKDLVQVDAEAGELRLVGMVPPGPLELRYFFELTQTGAELDYVQQMELPAGAGTLTMLDEGTPPGLIGPAVASQQSPGSKNKLYQLTPIAAGGALEFTFTDLPHQDMTVVTVVLVLAGLIALWGVAAGVAGRSQARHNSARREQLLDQLAGLKGDGKKDDKHRQALLDQLRAVWDE